MKQAAQARRSVYAWIFPSDSHTVQGVGRARTLFRPPRASAKRGVGCPLVFCPRCERPVTHHHAVRRRCAPRLRCVTCQNSSRGTSRLEAGGTHLGGRIASSNNRAVTHTDDMCVVTLPTEPRHERPACTPFPPTDRATRQRGNSHDSLPRQRYHRRQGQSHAGDIAPCA